MHADLSWTWRSSSFIFVVGRAPLQDVIFQVMVLVRSEITWSGQRCQRQKVVYVRIHMQDEVPNEPTNNHRGYAATALVIII